MKLPDQLRKLTTAPATRAALIAVVFAAAIYASDRAGLPRKANGHPADLPSVALGWRLLFHVERAATLLATLGLVALVGWRALKGQFPVKFGQVEYAVQEAVGAAADVAASQEQRIRYLEVEAGLRDPTDV